MSTSPEKPASNAPHAKPRESTKDTIISIILAFTLAFVFRGFVVEAFVIPTGSMAPTLLGRHLRFDGPGSGADWAVNPRERPGAAPAQNVDVHDPATGQAIRFKNPRRRSGDRILVLKHPFVFTDPARFDVLVFKNPTLPGQNYIKRCIGLPNEQIALVDGDVFARPASEAGSGDHAWDGAGWTIARKPKRVQDAVWQTVFDSSMAALPVTDAPLKNGSPLVGWPTPDWFNPPWDGTTDGWTIGGGRAYAYTGSGPTELVWRGERAKWRGTFGGASLWGPTDFYPYNELEQRPPYYPVSDVRMRFGIEPEADVDVTGTLEARGHVFRVRITPAASGAGSALLESKRVLGVEQADQAWETLADAELPSGAMRAGRITDVEFIHVDQALELRVKGKRVLRHEYDLTPAERYFFATGQTVEDTLLGPWRGAQSSIMLAETYTPPKLKWSFQGGPFTLYRVALDRDLHYRPNVYRDRESRFRFNQPALATHPDSALLLQDNQFFMLGDNSPASLDGRLMGEPAPWVAAQIDETPGVVDRRLLMGKAFFVYFPSILRGEGPLPMIDFGRIRFIH